MWFIFIIYELEKKMKIIELGTFFFDSSLGYFQFFSRPFIWINFSFHQNEFKFIGNIQDWVLSNGLYIITYQFSSSFFFSQKNKKNAHSISQDGSKRKGKRSCENYTTKLRKLQSRSSGNLSPEWMRVSYRKLYLSPLVVAVSGNLFISKFIYHGNVEISFPKVN